MKVKIKNTYKIWVEKEFENETEVDLLNYLEDCTLTSEEDLIECICEYILWDDNHDLNITDISDDEFLLYDDSKDNIIITNLDEIVEKYKYLIKEESCCDNETGNYCSTCGKKLK